MGRDSSKELPPPLAFSTLGLLKTFSAKIDLNICLVFFTGRKCLWCSLNVGKYALFLLHEKFKMGYNLVI